MKFVHRMRNLAIVIVTLSLVMISLLPVSGMALPTSQKWALLVGVSDYSTICGYGDLNWCHKDVADMYNILVKQFGWMPSHIKCLVNSSATEANIIAGISWLKENSAKCLALFYFSGHGSFAADKIAVFNNDEPKDQCIVPYDGNTKSFANMIFDDSLKVYFSGFKAAQTVCMFDSCYSGGMIDEIGTKGRLIMAACEAHEMSWEGGNRGSNLPIQNGVYTYLLKQAFDGAGDTNSDGIVSFEEAAQYATTHTRDLTESVHAQTYDGIAGDVLP